MKIGHLKPSVSDNMLSEKRLYEPNPDKPEIPKHKYQIPNGSTGSPP
jgi:hypothetical protein